MSGRRAGRARRAAEPPSPPSDNPVARRWIWYRNERGGRKIAEEEFRSLDTTAQAGLAKRVERYLSGESRYKDVDHLGDGIFELRHRIGNNHFRVLFMLWGPHCVALTAFYKNQQATPRPDLKRAKTRAAHWTLTFGDKPPD